MQTQKPPKIARIATTEAAADVVKPGQREAFKSLVCQAVHHQPSRATQRPPKRHKGYCPPALNSSQNVGPCGDCPAGNNGDTGVTMGANGTDVDVDGCSGSTPMTMTIGDTTGGCTTGGWMFREHPDECSGNTPRVECGSSVGTNHDSSRGISGSRSQPQVFQIHEPVAEHCLTDSDSALECDEVATEGKRLGEQWPQRVEAPKRQRKPG